MKEMTSNPMLVRLDDNRSSKETARVFSLGEHIIWDKCIWLGFMTLALKFHFLLFYFIIRVSFHHKKISACLSLVLFWFYQMTLKHICNLMMQKQHWNKYCILPFPLVFKIVINPLKVRIPNVIEASSTFSYQRGLKGQEETLVLPSFS